MMSGLLLCSPGADPHYSCRHPLQLVLFVRLTLMSLPAAALQTTCAYLRMFSKSTVIPAAAQGFKQDLIASAGRQHDGTTAG
jgi:hypothetical protein